MKAAEQGVIHAQCLIGAAYAAGDGVKKDEAKAFEWLMKAAEQGDAHAQRIIGSVYDEQDKAKAFHWFMKAAEQGDAQSISWVEQYHSTMSDKDCAEN
jgi:uncharacterized protein